MKPSEQKNMVRLLAVISIIIGILGLVSILFLTKLLFSLIISSSLFIVLGILNLLIFGGKK